MDPLNLAGKTILMTGALGAISEFVIKTLHAARATLILTDRVSKEEAAEKLCAWGVADAPYFPMDVTDYAAVAATVAKVFEQWPGLEIALGHAGGTPIAPFLDTPMATFDALVRFNLLGQTAFAHAVTRQWRSRAIRGHLVFTSSYCSRLPMAGITAYSSAKAGLEMLTKSLALELAPLGIRVNGVAPGNVAAGSSLKVYESDPVYRAWVDRVSPLGSRNTPQAIANAFLFLCSPLADELDGHVMQVDMGVGIPKLG